MTDEAPEEVDLEVERDLALLTADALIADPNEWRKLVMGDIFRMARVLRSAITRPTPNTPNAHDGKWCASSSEEHFSDSTEFDTKEEAIAYAISELAPNEGVEDGGHVWVGQIRRIDRQHLAKQGTQADRVIENLAEWIGDNTGAEEYDALEDAISKEDEKDLDRRLDECVLQWMVDRNIEPTYWHIDHMESVVFHQCDKQLKEIGGLHDEVVVRCKLHLDHEGQDCEI